MRVIILGGSTNYWLLCRIKSEESSLNWFEDLESNFELDFLDSIRINFWSSKMSSIEDLFFKVLECCCDSSFTGYLNNYYGFDLIFYFLALWYDDSDYYLFICCFWFRFLSIFVIVIFDNFYFLSLPNFVFMFLRYDY